jgi:MoxR-like ATPase
MSDPLRAQAHALLANLAKVILGKPEALRLLLIGVLAEGHVLLEDVPGVGKTTLARALASSLALEYRRVQFTPDLMPSDILGGAVLQPADGSFEFRPGPIFTHVLLADEINRASPRTQAALLEAMSERQITSDGTTRPLEAPFFVLATQNPTDFEGTYPLPEAQLDRFLLRLRLGYPDEAHEVAMLFAQQVAHPIDTLAAVAQRAALLEMQRVVRAVTVARPVGHYIVQLVRASRGHPDLALGASPRGALAIFRAAQANAWLAGRDYVTPDDVQHVTPAVLGHRLRLAAQAEYAGRSPIQVVDEILETVPVPV